jgi:hypothetical protein
MVIRRAIQLLWHDSTLSAKKEGLWYFTKLKDCSRWSNDAVIWMVSTLRVNLRGTPKKGGTFFKNCFLTEEELEQSSGEEVQSEMEQTSKNQCPNIRKGYWHHCASERTDEAKLFFSTMKKMPREDYLNAALLLKSKYEYF